MAPEFETLLVAGVKQDTEESSGTSCRSWPRFIQLPEMAGELSWSNDRAALQTSSLHHPEYRPDIVHSHAAKAEPWEDWRPSTKGTGMVHTFHGHVFTPTSSPIKTRIFLKNQTLPGCEEFRHHRDQ